VSTIKSSVEPWIEMPIRQFVEESGVVLALLLHPTGQVMGQHGFTRAMDIMSACALAAAINASAAELGRQVEGKPFRGLHHAGTARQLFLAETPTARGPYILLTVFNEESSLGLVNMYFDEFRTNLASAAPPPPAIAEPVLNEHFERDLNKNLAALFGRA
jgi:hypothetical protein